MSKITYDTKVTAITNELPNVNKVTSGDMNEIKTSTNALYDLTMDYLLVKSTDDLTPYLSGDEYILPTGLVLINGTIDLVDKAVRVSTGTVLRGLSDGVLVSTNVSGVVRATNIGSAVILREFNVVCNTGPCLVLTGTDTYQLNIFFVGMIGLKAAVITGFNVQSFKQCYINCAEGITLDGTTNKLFISDSPFYSITGSAITLASTLVCTVADLSLIHI